MLRKFTIGREKTCDFPVTDESVSRLHAEIWLAEDGALTLADHGSSNGTTLVRSGHSMPLLQTALLPGDEIKFGAALFKVKDVVDAIEVHNPGALTPKAPPKAAPPPLPPPPPAAAAPPTAPPAVPPPSPSAPPRVAGPPPVASEQAPQPPPVAAQPPPAPPKVERPPQPKIEPPPPAAAKPAPVPPPPQAPPVPPQAAGSSHPAPPQPAPPPAPAGPAHPHGTHAGDAPLLPAAPPAGKVNPVVGWLVCLEGPDRGHDYPLRAGNNVVGRSPSMDVCIANDAAVSRERHCIVAFDAVRDAFLLSPNENISLLYLNGESVRAPRHLTRDDVIDVGRTKLVFIPFCDGKYRWDG